MSILKLEKLKKFMQGLAKGYKIILILIMVIGEYWGYISN